MKNTFKNFIDGLTRRFVPVLCAFIWHANIVPALTTFPEKSVNLSMPDSIHWIGQTLDTTRIFRNIHSMRLMQNKNQLSDYISGSLFLSGTTLFEISDGLNLSRISRSEKKQRLAQELAQFKSDTAYATQHNKLYPERYRIRSMEKYEFITQYVSMFQKIDSTNLGVDQQIMKAREYAFEGYYDKSRAISKRLLLGAPDYHDVRILIRRTYAWSREYYMARKNFREVIWRDSTYYDTYNALFDTEYWTGNYSTAHQVINKGLAQHPLSEKILQKKSVYCSC